MEDYMIRAFAAGGYVRAFAVTTGNLTEEARQIHHTTPVATAALGRLMAAGVMMGAMMKDEQDLLTLKIDGSGPIRGILVTADCRGNVKGYPYEPAVILPPNEKGKLDVSGALGEGILTTISDIGMKEPYVGQVKLVSGEIAEDLTYYFAVSDQIPTSVGLGVLLNISVAAAGGFIIQLMPGCPEETVTALEDRLKGIDSVTTFYRNGKSPEDLLTLVLGDMDLQFTDKMPCRYHCGCTRQRVEKALISIGKAEMESMIRDGEPVTMHCDFCNTDYTFEIDELKTLLASLG